MHALFMQDLKSWNQYRYLTNNYGILNQQCHNTYSINWKFGEISEVFERCQGYQIQWSEISSNSS